MDHEFYFKVRVNKKRGGDREITFQPLDNDLDGHNGWGLPMLKPGSRSFFPPLDKEAERSQ